jgi:hypothetical protein
MAELIGLLVAVIIFALLWYAIGLVPFPPPLANTKWLFYILLILLAVFWLVTRYMGGAF